jgi:predicted branched-subunit amino acid permease
MGNVLPSAMLGALGVGLYGMFISFFIPEAKSNRIVAVLVIISFILSAVFEFMPYINSIPSGVRIIILTVLISLGAAIFFPIKDQKEGEIDG